MRTVGFFQAFRPSLTSFLITVASLSVQGALAVYLERGVLSRGWRHALHNTHPAIYQSFSETHTIAPKV